MLCAVLCFGCVDDIEDIEPEAPGVLKEEKSYWVDDVMVNQRVTVINSYDQLTYHFRGSVKNLGSDTVENARFEVRAYDVYDDIDGETQRRDEEVGASQSFGDIPSQGELPINVSYSYSSFARREVEGVYTHE